MAGDLPVAHLSTAFHVRTGFGVPNRIEGAPRIVLTLALALTVVGCAAPTAAPSPGVSPTRGSATPASAEVPVEAGAPAEALPEAEAEAATAPEPATASVETTMTEPPAPPKADAAPESGPEAEPEPIEVPEEPAPEASPIQGSESMAEPAPDPVLADAPSIPEPPALAAPVSKTIAGRVILRGGNAEIRQTMVYFEPEAGTAPPAPGVFDIETRNKTFDPTVIVVPRGSEVRFPNRDPILHNVFSVSGDNAFDLGVYGPDTAPATTLVQAGAVNVYCNVHHDMHAHVLVLDTPWYAQVGADGRFTLDGLPPGPGTLRVWHRQAESWSIAIGEASSDSIEVNLNIVRPQLPEHMDKTGQSYFRRDRDPYR